MKQYLNEIQFIFPSLICDRYEAATATAINKYPIRVLRFNETTTPRRKKETKNGACQGNIGKKYNNNQHFLKVQNYSIEMTVVIRSNIEY